MRPEAASVCISVHELIMPPSPQGQTTNKKLEGVSERGSAEQDKRKGTRTTKGRSARARAHQAHV